jgi:predicted nuclease of predicted toxin-antitoxin system
MRGAEDEEIARRAVIENRVIITNDKGFGRLAEFYSPPGIILLRLKDESADNKVKVMSFMVTSQAERIPGNLLVVTEKKIRSRPITKS